MDGGAPISSTGSRLLFERDASPSRGTTPMTPPGTRVLSSRVRDEPVSRPTATFRTRQPRRSTGCRNSPRRSRKSRGVPVGQRCVRHRSCWSSMTRSRFGSPVRPNVGTRWLPRHRSRKWRAGCHTARRRRQSMCSWPTWKCPNWPAKRWCASYREKRPDLKVLYVYRVLDRLFSERPVLAEGEAFVEKPFTSKGLLEALSLLLYGTFKRPK